MKKPFITWIQKSINLKKRKRKKVEGQIMSDEDSRRRTERIREDREVNRKSHDQLIEEAKVSGNYGVRSDAYAEGVGYLGVDDLDKIRRRKLR